MIRVRKLSESSFSLGLLYRKELEFDSLSFLTLVHGSLVHFLKNREPDRELLVLFPGVKSPFYSSWNVILVIVVSRDFWW